MKTNKSYAKRLKPSRSGKLLGRKAGQNHFNAKESQKTKGAKGDMVAFRMSNKARSRFLVNLK